MNILFHCFFRVSLVPLSAFGTLASLLLRGPSLTGEGWNRAERYADICNYYQTVY